MLKSTKTNSVCVCPELIMLMTMMEVRLMSPYPLMNGRLVRQTSAVLAKLKNKYIGHCSADKNISSLVWDRTNKHQHSLSIIFVSLRHFYINTFIQERGPGEERNVHCNMFFCCLKVWLIIQAAPSRRLSLWHQASSCFCFLTCLCVPPRPFCPKAKYWWGPFCPCSPISSSSSESEIRISFSVKIYKSR